eukprot:766665-Hanusia_phi.AAC.3
MLLRRRVIFSEELSLGMDWRQRQRVRCKQAGSVAHQDHFMPDILEVLGRNQLYHPLAHAEIHFLDVLVQAAVLALRKPTHQSDVIEIEHEKDFKNFVPSMSCATTLTSIVDMRFATFPVLSYSAKYRRS